MHLNTDDHIFAWNLSASTDSTQEVIDRFTRHLQKVKPASRLPFTTAFRWFESRRQKRHLILNYLDDIIHLSRPQQFKTKHQ